MNLEDELISLAGELDRMNAEHVDQLGEQEPLNWTRASNGVECHFSRAALAHLGNVGRLLHENRSTSDTQIELPQLCKRLRQVVADMYAEGQFQFRESGSARLLKGVLRARLEERVRESGGCLTHFFPVWTTGMERRGALKLGPVSLMSVSEWLSTVEIHPNGRDERQIDPRWKDAVLDETTELEGNSISLVGRIRETIGTCTGILVVEVDGFEMEYSRKLARIVCQTYLDTLSLLHLNVDAFQKQSLYDERLAPTDSVNLVATGGHLWISSGRWVVRHPLPSAYLSDVRKYAVDLGGSIAKVLVGLQNPSATPHPGLSARWATALNWFAEGCREPDDALALAKIGTCLDVISNGGRTEGILTTVCNLTGRGRGEIVTRGHTPRTLEQLVARVYEYGRSQILHGNHVDRLKSFAEDRIVATQLAAHVLRASLGRFEAYSGADRDNAFRSMPAPVTSAG